MHTHLHKHAVGLGQILPVDTCVPIYGLMMWVPVCSNRTGYLIVLRFRVSAAYARECAHSSDHLACYLSVVIQVVVESESNITCTQGHEIHTELQLYLFHCTCAGTVACGCCLNSFLQLWCTQYKYMSNTARLSTGRTVFHRMDALDVRTQDSSMLPTHWIWWACRRKDLWAIRYLEYVSSKWLFIDPNV